MRRLPVAVLLLAACHPASSAYLHTEVPAPVQGTPATGGGVDPLSCPLQAPGTSEPTGDAIDSTGFGCFGACGPSCMAECDNRLLHTARDVVDPAGNPRCVRCSYQLLECRSHAYCRWHDDCYRQCDLRWSSTREGDPPGIPFNACYRACDGPALHGGRTCAVDWAQVTDPSVQLRDDCWDGSSVAFTRLVDAPAVTDGPCPGDGDHPGAPWDPSTAAWHRPDAPPATLPHHSSCEEDTDCPDRNQRCDTGSAHLPGTGGRGKCVDARSSVDVSPLVPPGLLGPGLLREDGAACALDHQCAGGVCRRGWCAR